MLPRRSARCSSGHSRRAGGLAGIARILAADLQVFEPVMQLYRYLNLRAASPVPKLQREMLITVVNGIIGGKP